MSDLLSKKKKNKKNQLKIAQTRHIKLNFDPEPIGNGIILYITRSCNVIKNYFILKIS